VATRSPITTSSLSSNKRLSLTTTSSLLLLKRQRSSPPKLLHSRLVSHLMPLRQPPLSSPEAQVLLLLYLPALLPRSSRLSCLPLLKLLRPLNLHQRMLSLSNLRKSLRLRTRLRTSKRPMASSRPPVERPRPSYSAPSSTPSSSLKMMVSLTLTERPLLELSAKIRLSTTSVPEPRSPTSKRPATTKVVVATARIST